MRKFTWTVLIVFVGFSAAFAQKSILKPVVKGTLGIPEHFVKYSPAQYSFEQALRTGGLAYMVPNKRVGAEALQKGVSSSVGTVRPTLTSRLKCKAYELCARHFKSAKLDALVERQLAQESFPAYYESFPKEWAAFHENTKAQLGTLEVILEAAYGEEEQFDGVFVETYAEVVALSKHPVEEGVHAGKALSQAYSQAMTFENGFFVIRVKATAQHPQDVLLLDIKDAQQIRWISMRQSIGGEWMDTYWMEDDVK